MTLVSQKDTTPGIHDTLSKRHDIVTHIHSDLRTGSDNGCLLEKRANDSQVRLELRSNGLSNIAESLENRRLELGD